MAPPERFELPTPRSEDECSKSAELWGLKDTNILYLKLHDKIFTYE